MKKRKYIFVLIASDQKIIIIRICIQTFINCPYILIFIYIISLFFLITLLYAAEIVESLVKLLVDHISLKPKKILMETLLLLFIMNTRKW